MLSVQFILLTALIEARWVIWAHGADEHSLQRLYHCPSHPAKVTLRGA